MKHKFAFKMTLWWLIVLLMLERFVLRRVMEKTPSPIRWAVTFLLVLVGWVLFYYTDFSLVLEHLAAMFGFAKTAEGFVRAAWIDAAAATVLRKYTVYPLLAFLCAMPILPAVKKSYRQRSPGAAVQRPVHAAAHRADGAVASVPHRPELQSLHLLPLLTMATILCKQNYLHTKQQIPQPEFCL